MRLNIFHAQPVGGTHPDDAIEPLYVAIDHVLADLDIPGPLSAYLGASLQRFEQQGQALADALIQHLPGGTVDQLLRALLQHKASHFVVSFADQAPGSCLYTATTDPDGGDE